MNDFRIKDNLLSVDELDNSDSVFGKCLNW